MKLSELFPRRYASGGDLQGKAVALTISKVVFEVMRPSPRAKPEKKPVVYFEEATKGVILGRTLAYQIAEIVGSEDTDHWPNTHVVLFPVPMKVAGVDRIAIRARKLTQPANGKAIPPPTLQDEDDF